MLITVPVCISYCAFVQVQVTLCLACEFAGVCTCMCVFCPYQAELDLGSKASKRRYAWKNLAMRLINSLATQSRFIKKREE